MLACCFTLVFIFLKMVLKLMTFNCRGLQDYVKRRKVFHYMRDCNCDIVMLQETHSSVNDETFWKSQWGEHAWFASYASNSRGVAILVRNSVSTKVNSCFKDPNGRFLILQAVVNNSALTLVTLFAPNNDDPDFYLEVFGEIDKRNSPSIIVSGDFNTVLGPLDYQGSQTHHSNKKASKMISILIDEFGLCDVWRNFHPTLKQYTRHQKNPRALSRLDFILVSNNFINNCVGSKILPGIQSDHSVVSLQFKDNQPTRGRGFWKFNCHYLTHDLDFVNLIKDKIKEYKNVHKDSDCNPNILWDALKCSITGICIEYAARKKKERKREKDNLLQEIERVKGQINSDNPSSNDSLFSELETLERKLNTIYDFETNGLIVRSRVRWLEEGEKSSKYFCNLENRTWEKKNVYRLKDSGDNMISDQNLILKEIHAFYKKLYSSQGNDTETRNGESCFEKIRCS